jgi:hypothetical protein
VPRVEKVLLVLPEHMSSPLVFSAISVAQYLVLRIVLCLSFLFLLAIVLSVLFRFMDSDYPFIWYLQTRLKQW